jgi:hypothetical protein
MDNYIFETEHLQLERKDRSDNYILTIYDRYGHFLDTLHLDKEDIEEIYHSLDEQKDVLGIK